MTVTRELVAELLAEEPSLNTLSNQFTLDEIWEMLEDKDEIANEEELYNALLDVMYKTRPTGPI